MIQEFINHNRRRNLPQREERLAMVQQHQPVTYEDIMDRHGNTLAELNITLCKNCLIPIKKENDTTTKYCEDCISIRQ